MIQSFVCIYEEINMWHFAVLLFVALTSHISVQHLVVNFISHKSIFYYFDHFEFNEYNTRQQQQFFNRRIWHLL